MCTYICFSLMLQLLAWKHGDMDEETDDATKVPETTKKSSSGLTVYDMSSMTVALMAGIFY